MFGLKWVILTRELTNEIGRTLHMVMLVSFDKPCEASSYAKSAYLSTPSLRGSCMSQVLTLAITNAGIILILYLLDIFSPFFVNTEQTSLQCKYLYKWKGQRLYHSRAKHRRGRACQCCVIIMQGDHLNIIMLSDLNASFKGILLYPDGY